uniref:Uncharacterized protein n=1 Tax=Alexandrium andersonii TaxID=327968 RepID=A0A7S2AN26_9DINO
MECKDSSPSRFIQDQTLRLYFRTAMHVILANTVTLLATHVAVTDDGKSLGIPSVQSGAAFRMIVNGSFLENVLNGHWDLLPGHPHPRGLQGCQFWTSWEVAFILGVNFCSAEKFRSLRPYCPTSCDCHRGMMQCPPLCPAAR